MSVLNFYLKNIRLVLKTTQKVCVVSMVNDLEKKITKKKEEAKKETNKEDQERPTLEKVTSLKYRLNDSYNLKSDRHASNQLNQWPSLQRRTTLLIKQSTNVY